MITKFVTKPFVAALAALSLAGTSMGDVLWIGTSNSTGFSNLSNYNPQPQSLSGELLIFDSKTSSSLSISSTGNINIGGLHIKEGATGFILNGGTRSIAITTASGIMVDANTHATIYPNVAAHNSSGVMNMTVGEGGSLTIANAINLATAPFYKKGKGTLFISTGTSGVRNLSPTSRSSFHFEEGTVQLASAARMGWSSDSTEKNPTTLFVGLGTTSTTATLAGSGNLDGRLVTAGTLHSIIAPAETLTIHTLDATEGVTFNLILGTSQITGAGTFTGSSTSQSMAFNFTGGEVGQAYTLFQYADLNDVNPANFHILTEGYTLDETFGTAGWLVDQQTGTIQVQFAAVPEPSIVGFLGVLSGGLLLSSLRQRLNLP